jgi:alkanesulfonate monooxygenase SsuD/methylene tetrahydromethanopterin reductase-like flavin-dependent oxidoreductase (luciferase family)
VDVNNFSVLPSSWGTQPPQPRDYIEIAKHAEDLGFYSIPLPHVPLLFYPEDVSGGSQVWKYIPEQYRDYYLDPLVVLPMMASATSRIKLGFDVMIAPFVHPFVWAKYLASLDVVTDGRVLAGFGLGSSGPTFPKGYKGLDSLGIDGSRRGTMSDECLELVTRLWTSGDPVTFDGKYFHASNVVIEPKPVQQPYPELWWAGHRDRSIARAARYGDYLQLVQWTLPEDPIAAVRDHFLPGLSAENQRFGGHAKLSILIYTNVLTNQVSLEELSRRYFDFQGGALETIAVGTPDRCAAVIRAFREVGVEHFVLDLHRHGLDSTIVLRKQMESFVRDVIPLLK